MGGVNDGPNGSVIDYDKLRVCLEQASYHRIGRHLCSHLGTLTSRTPYSADFNFVDNYVRFYNSLDYGQNEYIQVVLPGIDLALGHPGNYK